MSSHVYIDGVDVGAIRLDGAIKKFVFAAKSLDSLEKLLGLNPAAIVEVEGQGKITYEQFRKKDLQDMAAFYPNLNAWLLKDSACKTIEEFEEEYSRQEKTRITDLRGDSHSVVAPYQTYRKKSDKKLPGDGKQRGDSHI